MQQPLTAEIKKNNLVDKENRNHISTGAHNRLNTHRVLALNLQKNITQSPKTKSNTLRCNLGTHSTQLIEINNSHN